jgi:hypothetical protein
VVVGGAKKVDFHYLNAPPHAFWTLEAVPEKLAAQIYPQYFISKRRKGKKLIRRSTGSEI